MAFELGGPSLSAARTIVRVNQALAMNVSVRALFLPPTVEKLAATIEKRERSVHPMNSQVGLRSCLNRGV